ncbi:hypothetical protein TcWFU_003484 [Taenia crassiceps]|uniref:Uncharacterized protein n=1 Tax=Taenia crassiceps TaxID=6207 RepID=A0ABR4Q697_9CEST
MDERRRLTMRSYFETCDRTLVSLAESFYGNKECDDAVKAVDGGELIIKSICRHHSQTPKVLEMTDTLASSLCVWKGRYDVGKEFTHMQGIPFLGRTVNGGPVSYPSSFRVNGVSAFAQPSDRMPSFVFREASKRFLENSETKIGQNKTSNQIYACDSFTLSYPVQSSSIFPEAQIS